MNREQRDALVLSHMNFACKLASELYRKSSGGLSLDELIQAAYFGLLQAAETFEPERGISFAGFAHRRIKGAVIDEVRKNAFPFQGSVGLQTPLPAFEAKEHKLEDGGNAELSLGRVDEGFDRNEVRSLLRNLAGELNEKEMCVLQGIIGGKTQADLARELSVTAGRVSQIVARLILKLRSVYDIES